MSERSNSFGLDITLISVFLLIMVLLAYSAMEEVDQKVKQNQEVSQE